MRTDLQSTHVVLGTSSHEAENCPGAHFTQTAAASLSPVPDPGTTRGKTDGGMRAMCQTKAAAALVLPKGRLCPHVGTGPWHLWVPTGCYPPCECFHPPGPRGRTLYLGQYLQGLETREAPESPLYDSTILPHCAGETPSREKAVGTVALGRRGRLRLQGQGDQTWGTGDTAHCCLQRCLLPHVAGLVTLIPVCSADTSPLPSHQLKPAPAPTRLFTGVKHRRDTRKGATPPGTRGRLETEEEEKTEWHAEQ